MAIEDVSVNVQTTEMLWVCKAHITMNILQFIFPAAYRNGLEGLKLLTTFKIGAQIDEDNVVDVYMSASSKLPALCKLLS